MKTAITYLEDNALPERGDFVRIDWPNALQYKLQNLFNSVPVITIEPRIGYRRDVTLLDCLALMLLWRFSGDLTDIIADFLWEMNSTSTEEVDYNVVTLETLIQTMVETTAPYLSMLPPLRWVPSSILHDHLILVAV